MTMKQLYTMPKVAKAYARADNHTAVLISGESASNTERKILLQSQNEHVGHFNLGHGSWEKNCTLAFVREWLPRYNCTAGKTEVKDGRVEELEKVFEK